MEYWIPTCTFDESKRRKKLRKAFVENNFTFNVCDNEIAFCNGFEEIVRAKVDAQNVEAVMEKVRNLKGNNL